MRPFGIGGELQPLAAGGGLLDEGVAVEAGAAGIADGASLLGLGFFVGIKGGFEFGAFGLGDFGELVGGGFCVDGLCPAFEDGAAVGDFEADAVFGEDFGVFGEVLLAGAGLESANVGEEGFLSFFFFCGALFFGTGGNDGAGTFAAGGFAEGKDGTDGDFGYVIVAGFFAGF